MRLPKGKQMFSIGCYYTMTPAMALVIRWYAWPFLMWKAAHKEYVFKWYQYPRLIVKIVKHTLIKWLGK